MVTLKCTGWWEQSGYGRQPMEELLLQFADGKIAGSGSDIVGDFEFHGAVDEDGIRLIKHYIGQHKIEYVGTGDGEGTYFGSWSYAGAMGGKWLIRVIAHA